MVSMAKQIEVAKLDVQQAFKCVCGLLRDNSAGTKHVQYFDGVVSQARPDRKKDSQIERRCVGTYGGLQ